MTSPALTITDLNSALEEIGERFTTLPIDDLFVLWFLRAFVTTSENQAAEAVSGGARDKGIDALLIDEDARTVFVVQGKYHNSIGAKSERRADVVSFAEVANQLGDPNDKAFSDYVGTTESLVKKQLKTARERILKRDYRIRLYFVTLGKVSAATQRDADAQAGKSKCADATLEVIHATRLMLIFRDYLDGVAPPIPTLDLEMEKGPNVTVNSVAQRYDDRNEIESWVFSMSGDKVAELYNYAGIRLFARNIRGFLGESTAINKGMVATLDSEPDRFFYYNNGVTILCDEATKKSRKGKDILQVRNPQVINGQQTTRTLANHINLAQKASVLVKVIQVTRNEVKSNDGFDSLVSRIVAGTNWQNAIRPSDLMANDRKQIELERALRKLGYGYLRKRQKKGEARSVFGAKHYRWVTKEEFAQIVAACDLDPIIARTKREGLFEEALYQRVFPNTDPNFYLPRFWLRRAIKIPARGNAERREAQWLVLNFAWSHLAPLVRGARGATAFRTQCETDDANLAAPLRRALDRIYVAVMKFYRKNRGLGTEAVDASTFFKSQRANAKAFQSFWHNELGGDKRFDRCFNEVKDSITQYGA